MLYDTSDTIVAIGTSASGGAARGIVRIGGPNAVDRLTTCFSATDATALETVAGSRCLTGGFTIADDRQSQTIPCDLYLWPDRRSYTRQPLAELHLPGSPPLLEAVVETLLARGIRIAQPGEFTLRAFLAGRIDLTQAEAVLGLVDASDRTTLDAALAQMAGGLSAPLMQLRGQLLSLLAELEAGLDFADEDIEFISREQLLAQITAAEQTVAQTLAQLETRSAKTPAATVVLAGPPNAGKSSLFNALVEQFGAEANSPQALVSEVSGTTRDYVSAEIELDSQRYTLVDTAGWDLQDADGIAVAAQQATATQRSTATLILHCQAADGLEQLVDSNQPLVDNQISVLTKCDLRSSDSAPAHSPPERAIPCSSTTGAGLAALVQAISERTSDDSTAVAAEGLALTAARCAGSLRDAREALDSARQLCETGGEELISAEIRAALDRLGEVVGAVYTDDVLDHIFSQFCIGK